MTFTYNNIAYPVVVITDGALNVCATYIGQVCGVYSAWLGTDEVVYFI